MEDLLEDVNGGSDELDFKAFCQLFEGAGDDAKSVVSRQSFISHLSERARK